MKRALLMVAAVSVFAFGHAAPAVADSGETLLAETISKCFHPTADFVRVDWTGRGATGNVFTKSGIVTYRPAKSAAHTMPFTVEIRHTDGGHKDWRVIADSDADSGGNRRTVQCRLLEWQSLGK